MFVYILCGAISACIPPEGPLQSHRSYPAPSHVTKDVLTAVSRQLKAQMARPRVTETNEVYKAVESLPPRSSAWGLVLAMAYTSTNLSTRRDQKLKMVTQIGRGSRYLGSRKKIPNCISGRQGIAETAALWARPVH